MLAGFELRCPRRCTYTSSFWHFPLHSHTPLTQFNLGWKIAIVEKNLAPRALLCTYDEERLPVIAWMLQETVNIAKQREDSTRDAAQYKGPIQHPRHLKQFGINYRWSSIVLDERRPVAPGEERDPYGGNTGGGEAPRRATVRPVLQDSCAEVMGRR